MQKNSGGCTHPRMNFIIHTDASEFAIGAVLLQEGKEDKYPRIISCASRTLQEVEIRWQVVEKEALALVYEVKQFKYYIEGKTTDVFTDQRAVLAIKSPKKNQSKLRRYKMALAAYNLNIYYKEGKANVLADLFSRNPESRQPMVLATHNIMKISKDSNFKEMRTSLNIVHTSTNFDVIFTIRSKQWKDEQRLLSVGRISTKEEKERLIKAQMDELTELMALCEIPEGRSAILSVIWDTRKANSLQNELSKTILRYMQKHVVLQPFTKESDSNFNKWKNKLFNMLSGIVTTDYSFGLA
uniref:RT_RNaseH domain-containing protein n=2 Tax=Strongyloides papillosus TaxID=174720 RepID=A0A0N5BB78_STREA